MTEKHSHHHHHHDYVKTNAEHFSENAATYRSELSIELAKRCAKILREKYSFGENNTEALDFACGPGLIALELLPNAKRIIGLDIAQGMVDVFNNYVKDQGISSDKLHCIKINSIQQDSPELNGLLFDVIFCAQAYHHFEDPVDITRSLAKYLKPNGRLFIIDFFNDVNLEIFFRHLHDASHAHIVAHKHGFSSEQMIDILKSAELKNPQVDNAFTMSKTEMKTYQGHEMFNKVLNSDLDFTLNYFIAYADK